MDTTISGNVARDCCSLQSISSMRARCEYHIYPNIWKRLLSSPNNFQVKDNTNTEHVRFYAQL